MGMSEVLDSMHCENWPEKERMHEHVVCVSGTAVWCYSHGDFEKACEMLNSVDWDQLMDEPNVDQC